MGNIKIGKDTESTDMDPQIESLRKYPCPTCGQSEYEFGQLRSLVMQYFIAGTEKFWNMPRNTSSAPKPMIARLCVHCRNIQSFERQFKADSEVPTPT